MHLLKVPSTKTGSIIHMSITRYVRYRYRVVKVKVCPFNCPIIWQTCPTVTALHAVVNYINWSDMLRPSRGLNDPILRKSIPFNPQQQGQHFRRHLFEYDTQPNQV